jgi:signal recognition particle receptor subunit beta
LGNNTSIKRLRIFAGPNGSGKTSLVKRFPEKMHLGVFVNADDIEKEMLLNGSFNAAPFGITVSGNELVSSI